MITLTEAQKILNLKTNEFIDEAIANRQLKVICKGYNFLKQPKNNVLYIADEVGLGKTYIAMGILTLFRHLSKSPKRNDLILVPKQNLQYKWQDELSKFAKTNYLGNKQKVNSALSNACLNDKLTLKSTYEPIEIYRTSSFSNLLPKGKTKTEIWNTLLERLNCNEYDAIESQLQKAWDRGWFTLKKDNFIEKRNLRNLIACMLNAHFPKINCLVVDEAHNYKYGPDIDGGDWQSQRNETTTRFLGAKNLPNVKNNFPELYSAMQFPLVNKVICLSATPKNRSLSEIKKQLSCFAKKHVLTLTKSEEDIEHKLNQFLIRGNLTYKLNGEVITRNKVQHEHRKGNVTKIENADYLKLKPGIEGLLWKLLQYKSIKHLNQKNNKSFELGMLAGFETYQSDLNTRKLKQEQQEQYKEYEEKNAKTNESEDADVIAKLFNTYEDKFGQLPPHPKQSKLVTALIEQIEQGEKSLIFVRRIATSTELAKRLLLKYEQEIVIDGQLAYILIKYRSSAVATQINNLIKLHTQKNIIDELPNFFENTLYHKSEVQKLLAEKNINKEQFANICFNAFNDNKSEIDFTAWTIEFINCNRINFYKHEDLPVINKIIEEYESVDLQTAEDDDDSSQFDYYFKKIFTSKGICKTYRQKMQRNNWFEFNFKKLFEKCAPIIASQLNQNNLNFLIDNKKPNNSRTVIEFALSQKAYRSLFRAVEIQPTNITSDAYNKEINETTFLTQLLIMHCHKLITCFIEKYQYNINLLIDNLELLEAILMQQYRNGSGLLCGYLADLIAKNTNKTYNQIFIELLTAEGSPFETVLNETKSAIQNFEIIKENNFNNINTENEILNPRTISKYAKPITQLLRNVEPVFEINGQKNNDKSKVAKQFRMPGYPYALISTDVLREGEDLHTFCQNVYHYGVAYNPSDMQQRTGRVDRINSLSYRKLYKNQVINFENKVQVFFPYLTQSLEVVQLKKLFGYLKKFITTFNDVAANNEYDSKVNINDEVTAESMEKQIEAILEAKYDVDKFIG